MFRIARIPSFVSRYVLTVGLVIIVAGIAGHYFSYTHECWILLSAFLICQTTRGTPLRQSMTFFIVAMSAAILASYLVMSLEYTYLLYFIFALYVAIAIGVHSDKQGAFSKFYFLGLLFFLILLIASLTPNNSAISMQNRLFDIVIGAGIAIVIGMINMPARSELAFEQGVIPVLKAINDYLDEFSVNLQEGFVLNEQMAEKKRKIEAALLTRIGMYPEWVYEAGFNRGLRSGYRFFLINLERAIEIMYSMEYLVSRFSEATMPDVMRELIFEVLRNQQELVSILIGYFEQHKLKDTTTDFTGDIKALESALASLVPRSLEILDISENSLLMTAFVRDMRDLRNLLLQLVMALPPADIVQK